MKGIWAWPSDTKAQDNILHQMASEDEYLEILQALEQSPTGLSNAQLDKLLANNSQWRTLKHMQGLIAVGFVRYDVKLFGNAGEYRITELGKTALARINAGLPPIHHGVENGRDYSLMRRFRWDWS
jgi:hypothetical protein